MLSYFNINPQELKQLIAQPFPPRQSAYHEIMWVQKGVATFNIDGDTFNIEGNAFFILPKDRMHQFLPQELVQGHVIRFSEDVLDDFPRLLFSKFNHISEITITGRDAKNLELLFQLFAEEYRNHDGNTAVISGLLKVIIVKLDEIKQAQFPCQKTYRYSIDTFDKFQLLLDTYVLQHKKVGFYAEKLRITPRKLGETIKSILNKSTSEIISERLLIECKRQLFYSTNNISEIAYDLGFEDNSYFTKFFKKQTAITPKEFRNNLHSVE